jgi:hypothetical protein
MENRNTNFSFERWVCPIVGANCLEDLTFPDCFAFSAEVDDSNNFEIKIII